MRDGVASETARRVAAHRLRCERVPTAYGRPDDDVALATDVARDVEIREGRLHAYLCARTAFFDHAVVAAIDEGVVQVVVVGAGYDGRSLRFSRDGVCFFEVDHPATQADKRARLERLGLASDAVAFVAVDLTGHSLVERLATAGLDRSRASLFVVEGLASYLPIDVLASTLARLRDLAAPGSRLAVSIGFTRTDGADPARVAAFRDAVAAMGEPIRSEPTVDEFDDLLEATGWRREPPVDDDHEPGARRTLGLVAAVPAARP